MNWLESLAQCPLSLFRIHIRLLGDTPMHEYKGSTFHGGFGRALAAMDQGFYQQWFETPQPQQPNAFVLRPPEDRCEHYQQGQELSFELMLFGDANAHWQDFLSAVLLWGNLGLGPARARFSVQRIESLLPSGSLMIYQQGLLPLYTPPFASVQDWALCRAQLSWQLFAEQPLLISIDARTRILLKQQQQVRQQAPSFGELLSAIERRLCLLTQFYHQPANELAAQLFACREKEPQAALCDHSTFSPWQRLQKSSGKQLPFGGLLGSWHYQGQLSDFVPLLALGELLHIGGKSSFGLGQYRFACAPAPAAALAQAC